MVHELILNKMLDEQPACECAAEIERLQELVRWAYSKLHRHTFNNIDDALKLDEMKLLLEQCEETLE